MYFSESYRRGPYFHSRVRRQVDVHISGGFGFDLHCTETGGNEYCMSIMGIEYFVDIKYSYRRIWV